MGLLQNAVDVIPSVSRGNGSMAIKRTGQVGFVEAMVSTKGGSGQLDRLDGMVKWYRFEKLIGHLRDEASPGRPGYPKGEGSNAIALMGAASGLAKPFPRL
jgi:hypothetical protein